MRAPNSPHTGVGEYAYFHHCGRVQRWFLFKGFFYNIYDLYSCIYFAFNYAFIHLLLSFPAIYLFRLHRLLMDRHIYSVVRHGDSTVKNGLQLAGIFSYPPQRFTPIEVGEYEDFHDCGRVQRWFFTGGVFQLLWFRLFIYSFIVYLFMYLFIYSCIHLFNSFHN